MPTFRESIFFFPAAGRRLLGVLHLPTKPSGQGFVYCHPFGEEKQLSHVIATKAARALCEQGHAVLRFDLTGCGDSEGDLVDADFETWLGDIRAAVEVLRERTQVKSMGLWGLRLGANLALHSAARIAASSGPVSVLLWQPLADLDLFMTQFLRNKVATGIAAGSTQAGTVKSLIAQLKSGEQVEVMGYPISGKLYESISQVRKSVPSWTQTPQICLIAYGQDGQLAGPMEAFTSSLKASGADIRTQVISEPTCWDRYWNWDAPQLIQATLDGVAGWTHGD